MDSLLLPPVPYDRTSIRPSWAQLPAALRSALAVKLGGEIVTVQVTGTGFTPGFAATLATAAGHRFFVKAAQTGAAAAQWYAQEARFAAALPSGVPAPALHWAQELADHFVLCFDAIEGARTPSLPWHEPELHAALEAAAAAATALATPPEPLLAQGPKPWSEVINGSLNRWRQPTPPSSPFQDHLDELVRLEAHFEELTAHTPGLMHCDLRLDNIVLDIAGRAWICDWNWTAFGPPWFDTMTLLISAEAGPLDNDALFAAHPTAAGLPADALDAALAAISGFYQEFGALPEVESSPALRSHQRYYGELSLRWLARRQGWI